MKIWAIRFRFMMGKAQNTWRHRTGNTRRNAHHVFSYLCVINSVAFPPLLQVRLGPTSTVNIWWIDHFRELWRQEQFVEDNGLRHCFHPMYCKALQYWQWVVQHKAMASEPYSESIIGRYAVGSLWENSFQRYSLFYLLVSKSILQAIMAWK